MSELVISETIELPYDYESACIMNEPDNTTYQYGLLASEQVNAMKSLDEWEEIPALLTMNAIEKVGVKHFPHRGAHAFVNLKDTEESLIFAPVFSYDNVSGDLEVTYVPEVGSIVVSMSGDTYECYRIVIRTGYFAEEYITYQQSMTISLHNTTEFTLYVSGYNNEVLASKVFSTKIVIE
ncbi:MAG: hypothetical protein R3Y58_01890 [Eubacteriales bacterium]